MKSIVMVFVAIFGIIIGSFLNVLIYRLPLHIDFVKGRSFCPKCGHKLNWIDLFPVFSYIFLLGKCRYCKERISPRYPIVELLNGISWCIVYWVYGNSFQTLIYFLVCSCLIIVAFIDIDTKIILDRFNIIIGVCGVILMLFSRDMPWWYRLVGSVIISVPLLAIAFFTNGMGGGDVKLFAACGLVLGWKVSLLAFIIASVTASIFGLILIARKRATGKTQIAFGEFIAFASIFCIFAGSQIVNSYTAFLTNI